MRLLLLSIVVAAARATLSPCSVTTGSVVVDLTPLTVKVGTGDRPYRAISTQDTTSYFDVNVCGPLSPTQGSAACSAASTEACATAKTDKTETSLGGLKSAAFLNSSAPGEGILLTYSTDDGTCGATIILSCGVGIGSPVLLDKVDSCKYAFQWRTDVVCINETVPTNQTNCIAVDEATGDVYDLSPLMRSRLPNWQVVDTTDDGKVAFDINICRPLVSNANFSGDCNDPGAFGCKRDRDSKTGAHSNWQSLGWGTRPVFMHSALAVSSSFGSKCTTLDGKSSLIQSRVDFICDASAGTGAPVLTSSTPCFYNFIWRTAFACPIRAAQGSNCAIASADTGEIFDFSNLIKKVGETAYSATHGTDAFYINICGALTGLNPTTKCPTGAGACQVNGGNAWSLGTPSASIVGIDNEFVLTYQSGDACSGGSRKTEIVITCDRQQVTPLLVFVQEPTACFYQFELRTVEACPSQQVECVAYDEFTGLQYDLSPLTRTTANWVVMGTAQDIEINVCAPIIRTGVALGCVEGSASCIVKSVNGLHSMGQVARPSVTNGDLTIHYVNDAGTAGETYIYFFCGSTIGVPYYVKLDNGRTLVIVWETSAACPAQTVRGENCRVVDPITGNTVNLNGLRLQGPQSIPYQDGTLQIAICDDVAPSCGNLNAGVCFQDATSTISYGEPSSSVSISDESLFLYMDSGSACGSGGLYRSYIDFKCDPKATGAGSLAIVAIDACTVTVLWTTAYACTDQVDVPNQCTLTDDDGNQYDLSALSDATSDWIAFSNVGNVRQSFEINVCRPLDAPPSGCSGAGMCQRLYGANYPVGGVAFPKYENSTGKLYVTYSNGTGDATCPTGRSGRIDFVCDHSAGVGYPDYVADTSSTCVSNFLWATYAACPVRITGATCTVMDPATGVFYNLTRLMNPAGYTVNGAIGGVNYEFTLSVCAPLTGGCNSLNDSSGACQRTTDGKTVASMGQFRHHPSLMEGQLALEFTHGDICTGPIPYARRTIVTLECEESDSLQNQITFLGEDTQTCTYYFTWRTRTACSYVHQTVNCRAVDSRTNDTYDLSPLVNNRRNYIADDNAESNAKQYQINICRPLVSGSHYCSGTQAACYLATTYNNIDYGQVASPVAYNGQLSLTYSSGASCQESDGSLSSHMTIIRMHCPTDDKGVPLPGQLGVPVFNFDQETCVHNFDWTTSYACPLIAFAGRNCQATDVLSGDRFNISTITGIDYNITLNGFIYHLSVCGPNPKCPAGMSACKLPAKGGNAVSLGKSTTDLTFDENTLSMSLTGGSNCATGGTYSSTVVFECNPRAGPSNTPLVNVTYDANCHTNFVIETSARCHTISEVECLVSNGTHTYDLSPLSNYKSNWVAQDTREDDKYSYVINVCRNLVPDNNYPQCNRNSAVCQVSFTDGTFLEENLGRPSSPQFINNQLLIENDMGDTCANGQQRKSVIYFDCGPEIGNPVFLSEVNCVYYFSWRSSAACAEGQAPTAPTNTNCIVTDRVTGASYDLRPLRLAGKVNTTGRVHLQVAVCGEACPGGGACLNGTSVGQANQGPYMVGETVHMLYQNGEGKCSNGYTSRTQINFVCDYSAGVPGTAAYVGVTDDCLYIVQWRTSTVCNQATTVMSCQVHDYRTGVNYDLTPLQRTRVVGYNWQAIDNRLTTFLFELNVCAQLLNPVMVGSTNIDPDSHCLGAAACQFNPTNGSYVPLPIGNLGYSPSIEDGSIVLRYSSADTTTYYCPDGREPRTRITFICRYGTLGEPVFDRLVDCEYFFVWATSAACQKEQSIGTACHVSDAVSGLQFDLSDLKAEVSLNVFGDMWYLQTCNALSPSLSPGNTNECRGAGVCQVMPNNTKVNWGMANDKLTYADGKLTLQYTSNQACPLDASTKRAAIIEYLCEPNADSSSKPYYVESLGCVTYFQWPTASACLQRAQVECTTEDPATGQVYDLSGLTKTSGTAWSPAPDSSDYGYAINVCAQLGGSVTKTTGCDETAGVCQIDQKYKTQYNLGGVAGLEVVNGNVVAHYNNGDPCQIGGQDTVRNTTITFVCGDSKYPDSPDGLPEFESANNCNYSFTWQTPQACPVQRVSGTNCKVSVPDPNGGAAMVVDLNPLASKQFTGIYDVYGHKYDMNFCGHLSPPCPANSSASICQTSTNGQVYSLGVPTGWVHYQQSYVTMMFVNGSVYDSSASGCGATARSAEVLFICDPCATPDHMASPMIFDEDNCIYTISVFTSLVCTKYDWTCPTPAPPSPPTPPPSPSPSKGSGGSSSTAIVIGVVVALIVVGIVVVLFILRKKFNIKISGYKALSVNTTNADDFAAQEDDDSEMDDA